MSLSCRTGSAAIGSTGSQFTQTHLCETPCCNISQDNCVRPHQNTEEFCGTICIKYCCHRSMPSRRTQEGVAQHQITPHRRLERKQKGGFAKGRFWRMCPRSGFWYRGTSEYTLVPVFCTGKHLSKPTLLRNPERSHHHHHLGVSADPDRPFPVLRILELERITKRTENQGGC